MPFILDNGIIPRQGPFPNPNIAAGFLGFYLIADLLRKIHRKERTLKEWVLFGVVFLAWGSTESRGALMAFSVTLVIYLILHRIEIESKLSRWTRQDWMVFGVFLLLLLLPLSFMLDRLFNFLGNLDEDPRRYFRLDIWTVSLKMVMAQPLLGFGPGTFGDVFSNFRPGAFWNVTTSFAHNEYLQVAAECGLPALLLTISFLAWILWGGFRVARKVKAFTQVPAMDLIRETAVYLVLFEAVHSLVDFTFHEWSHRLVLLGFLTRAFPENAGGGDLELNLRFSRTLRTLGSWFLGFLVLWILGNGSWRDYRSELKSLQAVQAFEMGDPDGAENFAKEAARIRPNFASAWDTLGVLEKTRGERALSSNKKEEHFRTADEYFRKAISLSPYSQVFLEHQVQAMFSRGRIEQALDLQLALIERSPQLPTQYKNLAIILLKLGRPQGALVAAQTSIDLDHWYLAGYTLKGQALMALSHPKEALETFVEERTLLDRMGKKDPSGRLGQQILALQRSLGISDKVQAPPKNGPAPSASSNQK